MVGLLLAEGVSCRACGAGRALASEEALPGVCGNCWNKFQYASAKISRGTIEDNFAEWLSRRLFLSLKRLKKNGVLGRCEACSDWQYGRRGLQCAHDAIVMRGNRRVCGLHQKSDDPRYVSEEADDPYVILAQLMIDLGHRDDRLREAVIKAAEEFSL